MESSTREIFVHILIRDVWILEREQRRAIVVALDCLNPQLSIKLDLEKGVGNEEEKRKTKRGKKRKK